MAVVWVKCMVMATSDYEDGLGTQQDGNDTTRTVTGSGHVGVGGTTGAEAIGGNVKRPP
jgi:hypothetical protein